MFHFPFLNKIIAVIFLISAIGSMSVSAQSNLCSGTLGPNLLDNQGTFSPPFITPDTVNLTCANNNTLSPFNPLKNIGNAISVTQTDYTYAVNGSNGLGPEKAYTFLKTLGADSISGTGNCIKTNWRGMDHTLNGGYMMAVNGDTSIGSSGELYKIYNFPVCPNTNYEFSAYQKNVNQTNIANPPQLSFVINGTTIVAATTGITFAQGWVRVGGTWNSGAATTASLTVQNAVVAASGNDFAIDDIYLGLCNPLIVTNSYANSTLTNTVCPGYAITLTGTVDDAGNNYRFYKWQKSTNNGTSWADVSGTTDSVSAAAAPPLQYTASYTISAATTGMEGYQYRMVTATTLAGLTTASCNEMGNQVTLHIDNSGSCIALTGNIYNDAGGMSNSLIDGTGIGSAGGQPLTINVVDSASGLVTGYAPVAQDGSFSLSSGNGISANTKYKLMLSSTKAVIGAAFSPTLPSNWTYTGEGLTTAGDGTPNGSLTVRVVTSAVTGLKFGIDQMPVNATVSYVLSQPAPNAVITLNGGSNPTMPGAMDAEDGALGLGKKFKIVTLPANSTLKYNSIAATAGQVIAALNPALLQLTLNTNGTTSTGFTYSYIDAAGMSGTAASYSLSWPGPLPLHLLSFNAAIADNTASLNWSASESNTSYYEVLRSADGRNFTHLDAVSAIPSSSPEIHNYQYTDEHPLAGQNYYQLRMVDVDGSALFSSVRSVDFANWQLYHTTLAPNPANDKVTLSFQLSADVRQATVRMYDFTGRMVQNLSMGDLMEGRYERIINISALPSGSYLVNLSLDGKATCLKVNIYR